MPDVQKVALVIRSLSKRPDSISSDCLGQYRLIRSSLGAVGALAVFVENTAAPAPPDVEVRPVASLQDWLGEGHDATVIYHWCDGWEAFDALFPTLKARKIIRWHNNTPPWFLAPYSLTATANTLRGLSGIVAMIAQPDVRFWVNSAYSARQLHMLGGATERIIVVYPVSALLTEGLRFTQQWLGRAEKGEFSPVRLLFVGRFVPHKGHRHLVAAAAHVQSMCARPIELHIAGHVDAAMPGYAEEVKLLAAQLGVNLIDHGEVPDDALARLYRESDVFLCLSEHEGFGLPVLEAMRLDLPVVGLRSTAVGEFLSAHPLAHDRLDHAEFARLIVASLQPSVRASVLRWQKRNVLATFTGEVVISQIRDGLGHGVPMEIGEPRSDPILMSLVSTVRSSMPSRSRLSREQQVILRTLPADPADRFVTLHDLAAFSALIEVIRSSEEVSLYKWIKRSGLSEKPTLAGRFFRKIRRAVVGLNQGIVAGIEETGRRSDLRLDRMARRLDMLSEQNAVLLGQMNLLLAERQAGSGETLLPLSCSATPALQPAAAARPWVNSSFLRWPAHSDR